MFSKLKIRVVIHNTCILVKQTGFLLLVWNFLPCPITSVVFRNAMCYSELFRYLALSKSMRPRAIEQPLCFHWLRLGLLLSGCCTQWKQPATNPVLKQRSLAAGVMRKFLSRLCSNVIFLNLFDHGPFNIHVITSQILVRIYGFEILVPPFKEPKKNLFLKFYSLYIVRFV